MNNDTKLGRHLFIQCPNCDTTIEYNDKCKCGYSTFDERMKQMSKEIEQNEKEEYGYKMFSELMDCVFDLADELIQKEDEHPEDLTEMEVKFLDAMDKYCETVEEDEED